MTMFASAITAIHRRPLAWTPFRREAFGDAGISKNNPQSSTPSSLTMLATVLDRTERQ